MRFLKSLILSLALITLTPIESSEPKQPSNFFFPTISFVTREQVVVPYFEFMNLYTDCNQKDYSGKKPTLKKTYREIITGVRKRRSLEDSWIRYFDEQKNILYLSMRDIDTTPNFKFPLKEGSFDNSFDYIRIREGRFIESHDAIDIFADTGSYIMSPISGVIVASGDNWKGSWTRRKGMEYLEGGLGKLSGNAFVVFDTENRSYYFMAHASEVYVKGGDIVSRGDPLGTVGKTGNAISPNVQSHLHIAYKMSGRGCGIDGVLVSQNPYPLLKNAKKNERFK
jgi:murein DD-endopeptidase MepM/ murein hydrolase activator NlpD